MSAIPAAIDILTPEEIDKLSVEEIREYKKLIAGRLPPKPAVAWKPFKGKPQEAAYWSLADELFFAGAAGPGKTDLLIGLALSQHQRSIIFRREFPQLRAVIDRMHELIGSRGSFNGQDHVWRIEDGRTVELGAVQHEWDVDRYQGRPHDLKAFDELPQLTQRQFRFLIGWNRTTLPDQRCRVVAAGNPPLNPEDRWVIEEWAPWLDNKYHDPALPGELRWYAMLQDKLTWLKSGEPIHHKGEKIVPRSRTFIPGRVDDNPILLARGYKSVLQGMPEPLRSQLLFGDMNAGTQDDPWQIIPTGWVRAAMERWTPDGAGDEPLTAIGVDVARGGKDKTTLAKRHKVWWDKLAKHPGTTTPDGPAVAGLIQRELATQRLPASRNALVCIDVIGVGASVYDTCRGQGMRCHPVNSGQAIHQRDSTNNLTFRNLRAWAYWHMRETLDPSNPLDLPQPPQLPDDPELLADLCCVHYKITPGGILAEPKEEIKKRIGRSPDAADAVVYSLLQPGVDWTIHFLDPATVVHTVSPRKAASWW